jgi:hypothetical protein
MMYQAKVEKSLLDLARRKMEETSNVYRIIAEKLLDEGSLENGKDWRLKGSLEVLRFGDGCNWQSIV